MSFDENKRPRDENGRFANTESSADRLKRIREKYFPHLTERKESGKLFSKSRKTVILSKKEYAHVMSEIATNSKK